MSSFSNPDELFDVVDAQDRVVGQAPRREVHAQNLLHRAVHVIVHDEAGRVFLQQRSQTKDTFPGCWDSSCSGHLDSGEDYLQAARRELGEEIGCRDLTAPFRLVTKLTPSVETGWEFIEIYVLGPLAGPFELNPDEIIAGRWIAPADLLEELRAAPEIFAGGIRLLWSRHAAEILALLPPTRSI